MVHYEPVPVCSCGGGKCRITNILEKKKDEEKIHQFLMGLEDGIYGTVCSNILSTDPLPGLNRVYAMVVQEERHRSIARNKEERGDVVGFSTQTGPNVAVTRTKEKSGTCRHCGRAGHEETECFQIIGYPKWWGDRPKGNGRRVA